MITVPQLGLQCYVAMVADSVRRNAGEHGQHGAAAVCSVVPQELNVKPDPELCRVSTTYCITRSGTQQLGQVYNN